MSIFSEQLIIVDTSFTKRNDDQMVWTEAATANMHAVTSSLVGRLQGISCQIPRTFECTVLVTGSSFDLLQLDVADSAMQQDWIVSHSKHHLRFDQLIFRLVTPASSPAVLQPQP